MLRLKNPHAVLAALQKRPRAVRSVEMRQGKAGTAWQQVRELAEDVGVAVSVVSRSSGRRSGPTERAGGNSALVEPPSPVPLRSLLSGADDSGGLWLGLDRIQDPQNLGALFRLAGFFGVRGILMTREHSAPVSSTVCDVAAGGVEYTPWSLAGNLAQAFRTVQDAGIWILGTSEHASDDIRDVPIDRPWMLVLGSEGSGLRRLTQERCDQVCAFPSQGPIGSLNVATAAAVCLTVLTSGQAVSGRS